MTWTILLALILVLAFATTLIAFRRAERVRLRGAVEERQRARTTGSHQARLQYPSVDLSRCIGCGSCVAACPEDGVLALVHGQAVVVHGARCVGHGRCAAECPVGAIALTLGDLKSRRDLPALDEKREVPTVPGLFLAGEVTGYALVRTAIAHGTAVADEVARRVQTAAAPAPLRAARRAAAGGSGGGVALAELQEQTQAAQLLDLVVVGAGPAGLSCSLRARELGLSFVTLEQDQEIGGTVAKYPRRKLVMTQPVELPLHGRLGKTSYLKEELVELWQAVAREHDLPVATGQEFLRVERVADGHLRVHTQTGAWDARNVCLALGRRGTPRKLGVPGEELSKVSYSLLDAHSYTQRRILVVGGGDSAIEAAVGLSEQPGNQVTISYRKEAFFRLKARNEARIQEALRDGALQAVFQSEVVAIQPESVHLRLSDGQVGELPNDEVFVFAGGTPPFEVLEASGVSFDPEDRPEAAPIAEQGTGIFLALCVALGLALVVLAWLLLNAGYYSLPLSERPHGADHERLSPSGTLGIVFGFGAAALVLANLAYLARRSLRFPWIPGSLQGWMTSHVVTGILALLLALVHSAMAPRETVGGHALWAMAFLVLTGAIGRYFYSFVPRAANGRELALEEVRAQLAAISGEWDSGRGGFADELRAEVEELVESGRWRGSFLGRVRALVRSEADLRRRLRRLRQRARAEGVASEQIERTLELARRAQRTALMAAHYEDLRGILASWRWFHRWIALGMVLLVLIHVVTALRYGRFGS